MYIDLQYVNLLFADIAGKLSVMDLFIYDIGMIGLSNVYPFCSSAVW